MMKSSMIFVIAFLTAILWPQVPWADTERGQAAFDTGDYATALKEWLPSARDGDAKALVGLGRLHEVGLGVPQDLVKAHLFYNLAAFRGNSDGRQARDSLERIMHPDEIERAKKWALDLVSAHQYVPDDMAAAPAKPPAKAPSTGAPAAPAQATGPAPSAPAPPPATATAQFEYQCELQRTWRDKGSGGRQDLSVYVPQIKDGLAAIGGFAQGNYDDPDGCVLLVDTRSSSGKRLTSPPANWQQIWTDEGSGSRANGSFWSGVPASRDFVCIGTIGVEGYQPPRTSNYVCVHRCLTTTVRPTNPIWSDEGTGAKREVSLYRLPYSNSYVAVPSRGAPAKLVDVRPGAQCP